MLKQVLTRSVTSKADIFEAKVASAVDEADSSDSDETFVYESNPTDPRPNRHHSRTPSATSLASQADQYGGRNKHGIRSGSNAIAGKKSMKFTNSAYSNHYDGEPGMSDSTRASTRNGGSTPRHHQIGRHSRAAHPSLFDTDSPFSQANKPSSPRIPAGNIGRVSRPNSPRVGLTANRQTMSPRKGESNAYDIYEDAADDERTPLMGSVRVNRNRRSRRANNSGLHNTDFYDEGPRGFFSRHGGCMSIFAIIALICIGVATFIVALNRPLLDVSVKHILNVLASEQELMLDLQVEATNNNLFAIIINDLDVNVFAESPYVGTTEKWIHSDHTSIRLSSRERRQKMSLERRLLPWPPFSSDDGVDEGTDPIENPEPGTQKMLLGRVLEFDSPLVFDAGPVRRTPASSVGEIRLAKPGNKTEVGGSARWEHVLQHPFDLIVRGVVKYQLPLGSKTRSAKIGSRVRVLPSDDSEAGQREIVAIPTLPRRAE